MKVVVVGLGIQGKKRAEIAGPECIGTVDPFREEATYKNIQDVPLNSYDAALVCTPDECKIEILQYLLQSKKHILVEKPLIGTDAELTQLLELAEENHVTCYTAYNHRFEPHFVRVRDTIQSGILGKIYHCRLFYGNGTARDVRNSPWRDKNAGVLPDLGSHLLDTIRFWFGDLEFDFQLTRWRNFENKSPDHVIISSNKNPTIDLEMSLLSWRNHFTCDLIGENGSILVESLCKWGPSKFTLRHRKLPSGRPNEEAITLIQPDPTWAIEYRHFKECCKKLESNIANDLWINQTLQNLTAGNPL